MRFGNDALESFGIAEEQPLAGRGIETDDKNEDQMPFDTMIRNTPTTPQE